MDFDEPEKVLPTIKDVKKICNLAAVELKRFSALTDKDLEEKNRVLSLIEKFVSELSDMTEIEMFADTLFTSELLPYLKTLVSLPDLNISASFLLILCDIAEEPNNIERIIKENVIETALKSCEGIDEVNKQSDAQFLYSTLELISTVIDGCDDSKDVAEKIIKDTNILKIVTKQFERNDFDDNVLSASEILAILLQISPQLVKNIDVELVSLIINFCANMRKTKQAAEDEAASNAFNIITLLAMDEDGSAKLQEVKAMEILLACLESNGTKTEKSSAKLAFNAIEACISGSEPFCEQFIDLSGLRKLFGYMNDPELPKKHSLACNVVSIIDSMLTQLPLDSTHIQRVIRKFAEKECVKVNALIAIAEVMFEETKFDDNDGISEDDDSFDSFCLACSSLVELVCFAPKEVKLAVIKGIEESKVIDSSLVVDGAIKRSELLDGTIKDRVENSIRVYSKIVNIK